MDNFEISNSPSEGHNSPIPFNSNDTGSTDVSHSPLNLGGSSAAEAPKVQAVPQPTAEQVEKKVAEKTTSTERITGVRTFFTKLHAGAIEFLDGQITSWLEKNPDIAIKRTNIITGEIQGKKTEPNIIVTVWY